MSEYGKLCEYLELIAVLKQSGRYTDKDEVKLLEDEERHRGSYVMKNYPFNMLEAYPESSLSSKCIDVNELCQICYRKASQLYKNSQERDYYYRGYLDSARQFFPSNQVVFDGDIFAPIRKVATEIRQRLPKVL
jgi:hypothetical protein